MLLGLGYLALSVTSLFFWRFNAVPCVISCPGQSWFLWGAIFFASAGFLSFLPNNRWTCSFLIAGAIFHFGLIVYGLFSLEYLCPVCLGFAFLGAGFAFAYWRSLGMELSWKARTSLFVVPTLVLAALVLLMNPQGGKSLFAEELGGVGKTGIEDRVIAEEMAAAVPGTKAANALKTEVEIGPEKNVGPENTIPLPFSASLDSLQVTAADGRDVRLDLRSKPALLFAAWCPPCDRALGDVAKLPPEGRPYLVVTYLRDGDAEKVKDKLARNGLAGEQYYLVERPPVGVKSVPALVGRGGK